MHELGNPEPLVSTKMDTSCWKTQLGPSSFAALGRRQHSALLEHKQLAVSDAQALGSKLLLSTLSSTVQSLGTTHLPRQRLGLNP